MNRRLVAIEDKVQSSLQNVWVEKESIDDPMKPISPRIAREASPIPGGNTIGLETINIHKRNYSNASDRGVQLKRVRRLEKSRIYSTKAQLRPTSTSNQQSFSEGHSVSPQQDMNLVTIRCDPKNKCTTRLHSEIHEFPILGLQIMAGTTQAVLDKEFTERKFNTYESSTDLQKLQTHSNERNNRFTQATE
jgi:hypothetical protein